VTNGLGLIGKVDLLAVSWRCL